VEIGCHIGIRFLSDVFSKETPLRWSEIGISLLMTSVLLHSEAESSIGSVAPVPDRYPNKGAELLLCQT
jgi:hypothetical protein